MKRAFLVATREYLENVRTKGFWIGILMMPVILLLVGIVPILVESTRDAKTYVVIDQTGYLSDRVTRQVNEDDLVAVLKFADNREKLPGPVADLAVMSDSLSDDAVTRIASAVVDRQYDANLDHPVDQHLARYGPEISTWWLGQSAGSRARLAPSVSGNFYQPGEITTTDQDQLNRAVTEGELFAYFVIASDAVEGAGEGAAEGAEEDNGTSRYVSNNLTDRDLLNWYTRHLTREVRKERVATAGVAPETADWISGRVKFENRVLSESGAEATVEGNDIARQWAPVVFVYLLWISILINTQMLLTNTIEEKSNKLIEVLLSSVSPIELMAGKIAGIAATGLTIISAWAIMAIGFFLLIPAMADITLPIDPASILSDPLFLGSFLVYFILGYLLYAALLVGLGSICNNLKEAQNLMLPVQLMQMVPIFVMVPIGRDPNGLLAQVLSYFPPLTPFIMMNRAAAPPTTFEYVTTTLLLLLSIVAALWFAAKIFRIGILLSGQPPSLRQVFRWLRAPTP